MYFMIGDEGDQTVYVGSKRDANSMARTLIDLGRVPDEVELPFRFTMTVSRGKEPRLDDWFEVAGVMVVNARIPVAVGPGNAAVTVSVGGMSTQSGVTIAVGNNP